MSDTPTVIERYSKHIDLIQVTVCVPYFSMAQEIKPFLHTIQVSRVFSHFCQFFQWQIEHSFPEWTNRLDSPPEQGRLRDLLRVRLTQPL
jgi:hypothetical protein